MHPSWFVLAPSLRKRGMAESWPEVFAPLLMVQLVGRAQFMMMVWYNDCIQIISSLHFLPIMVTVSFFENSFRYIIFWRAHTMRFFTVLSFLEREAPFQLYFRLTMKNYYLSRQNYLKNSACNATKMFTCNNTPTFYETYFSEYYVSYIIIFFVFLLGCSKP